MTTLYSWTPTRNKNDYFQTNRVQRVLLHTRNRRNVRARSTPTDQRPVVNTRGKPYERAGNESRTSRQAHACARAQNRSRGVRPKRTVRTRKVRNARERENVRERMRWRPRERRRDDRAPGTWLAHRRGRSVGRAVRRQHTDGVRARAARSGVVVSSGRIVHGVHNRMR